MKRFLGLILLCYSPIFLHSQSDSLPKRFVENVSDGILITYEFPKPTIQPNFLIQGSSFLRYSGFGINDIQGEPAIPFRSDLFFVPNGYYTRVDIIETNYNDTSYTLSPSIPYRLRNEIGESIDSIKPYHGFFPSQVIENSDLDDYRGVGLQRITIMPIQYNYEHHIARIYSKIKYKISFLRDETNTHAITHPFAESQNIKDLLSKITLNYSISSSSLPREVNNAVPDTTNYLIITVNEYMDSLQSFIEWKRIKGNKIFLQAKNRGDWTTDSIKKVINQIDSLHSLDYVLMVGGFEDVPADSFVYDHGGNHYYCVTDYAYGLPTTDLQIAQISRGRIPVDNSQELSIILNKIMKYERNPIRNEEFYRKALHCGEFQDDNGNNIEDYCFILTNENLRYHLTNNYSYQIFQSYYYVDSSHILEPTDTLFWNNNLYSNGEALPDSLQPSNFSWNENLILSKINEGISYVLYNGHGSKGGWIAPGFTREVNLLQNGDKQPIVFSLACLTGKYNENGDCFAEKMLKKENGGCVGMIAATENSFLGFDDAMAYGMFDAIWPNLQLEYNFNGYGLYPYTSVDNPIYEMGKDLDWGLLRMAETFGRNQSKKRGITQKLYHYFGDPSMMIYTDVPQDFIEPTIKYVNGKICVQSPCDSTRITFYTPSASNPIIETFVGDSIEYETNADSVIICLDKHNYVPYVQTFYKNLYIQNETINGNRNYVGNNILIGNHVTTGKPTGNVIIEGANMSIQGNSVKLHPGTRINHSNVKINTR